MCLAIPGLIKEINGYEGLIDVSGVSRTISLMLIPEAKVGDYVYVHTGFAISVIDEPEAMESLRLLQELAETYPVDELFYTTGDMPAASIDTPET